VVTLAALIIALLYGWHVDSDVKNLNDAVQDVKSVQNFAKVDVEGFAFQAYQFWQTCNSTDSLRLYVYENESASVGTLDKQRLFETYISLQWCNTIQSKALGCGEREDVQMGSFSLPRVVELRCSNSSLTVS
jgi:hypothetical protein